jgi:hypothetical protein
MWGKFESRFKRRDESSVNAARRKHALSTQVLRSRGFRPVDHSPLTVLVRFSITYIDDAGSCGAARSRG